MKDLTLLSQKPIPPCDDQDEELRHVEEGLRFEHSIFEDYKTKLTSTKRTYDKVLALKNREKEESIFSEELNGTGGGSKLLFADIPNSYYSAMASSDNIAVLYTMYNIKCYMCLHNLQP